MYKYFFLLLLLCCKPVKRTYYAPSYVLVQYVTYWDWQHGQTIYTTEATPINF